MSNISSSDILKSTNYCSLGKEETTFHLQELQPKYPKVHNKKLKSSSSWKLLFSKATRHVVDRTDPSIFPANRNGQYSVLMFGSFGRTQDALSCLLNLCEEKLYLHWSRSKCMIWTQKITTTLRMYLVTYFYVNKVVSYRSDVYRCIDSTSRKFKNYIL